MFTNKRAWALLLLALVLIVAACGDDDDTSSSGDSPSADESEFGRIVISGSSTVEPISARVGQAYEAIDDTVATTVEGPGTGDGFSRFCAGETDISDASRAIKESETEECVANGIEYVELHIATDGISVITSPENPAITCLDFNDMYAIVGPESEGFADWNGADSLGAELGASHAPYPAAPLVITAPGDESGTYDTFVELVIEDIADERGQSAETRVDYNAEANDQVIVNNIANDATSFGWVGFAFYEENAASLKAIEVDDGESGCVAPTAASIASFDYPLSRPLYIYVKTNDLANRADLVSFVDFYLSDEGLVYVSEAGYVQLPSSEMDGTRQAWESANG